MATFAPAFPQEIKDKKMSKQELINAIQLDIAAELEAIYLYETQASVTDDVFVKNVLLSSAKEEKVHVGEFLYLLYYLDPEYAQNVEAGMQEARNFLSNQNKGMMTSHSTPRYY